MVYVRSLAALEACSLCKSDAQREHVIGHMLDSSWALITALPHKALIAASSQLSESAWQDVKADQGGACHGVNNRKAECQNWQQHRHV